MKYAISIILGIVAIAIGASLWLVGSPATVRKERMDEMRLRNLQEIQSSINIYWQSKRELPASLTDVVELGVGRSILDPETGAPYEYTRSTTTTFELCATFITSSTLSASSAYPQYYGPYGLSRDSWDHPAGRHCFKRTFDPALLPPVSKEAGVAPRPVFVD